MESKFSNAIEDGFKELLERKHLYQSTVIAFPPFDEIYEIYIQAIRAIPAIDGSKASLTLKNRGNPTIPANDAGSRDIHIRKKFRLTYDSSQEFNWIMESEPYVKKISKEKMDIGFKPPPTIKLFCSICDGVQPYNYFKGLTLDKGIEPSCKKKPVQIFILMYECQACKNPPEIFMIRREGMKLIQSGRTPMERVQIPGFIPKSQKKFFSDAIIAFNSGQILAGKFLLRTFIEQYIRDKTNDKTSKRMDELLEQYTADLPIDFRKRFPSLTKLYDQLSMDIHKADSSADLFIQAQKDIEDHFDAKRVFDKAGVLFS